MLMRMQRTPGKPTERERRVAAGTVMAAAVLAVAGLGWWFRVEPLAPVERRVPFQDGTSPTDAGADWEAARVQLDDWYERVDVTASPAPGVWPQFRGPNRDNIGPAEPVPAASWPDGGPPVLWEVPLGEGYAGPAIWEGRVYVLDYDEEAGGDLLRCFRLQDGRELWRRGYAVRIKRNHGMSRTVPAVSDGAVVTIGPKCQVLCADAESGDFRWGFDLAADFGTKVPLWYTGQCPLIDGETVVLAVCGRDDLMLGVDLMSGEVLWRTPNPRGWDMSHSSVMPLTLAGRRTYVYPAMGGLVGVAADGPDAGTVLWETTEWNLAVVAPSAVAVGSDRLLVTAGYGAGSMIFHIQADGNGFTATKETTFDKRTFGCEQQTPIWYREHLYGVMPADAGGLNRQLVCVAPDGTLRWSSGQDRRFGLGPFMIAGNRLFALAEDGELIMAETSTTEYRELAAAKVLDGREAWAPMAIAGTRLLVRDNGIMRCLDISDGSSGADGE